MEPGVRPGFKPVTVRPAIVVEPVKVAGPETVRFASVVLAADSAPVIEALPETVIGPLESWPLNTPVPAERELPTERLLAESWEKPATDAPEKFWLGRDG